MPPSARTARFKSALLVKWLVLAAALCACGAYAYFLMFSRFGFWDDEGYLMATVRAMLQGHLLYDQIYTLYGPFYYLFEGALYTVTGAPVTHDFTRFVGLFFWLASAILASWSVLRLTGSFLLAGLTLFAVSKVLVFFSGEPGHPEELCIFCICLLLAVFSSATTRLGTWSVVAAGFLLAALSFTKINIGLYAIWAVLLTLLSTAPVYRIKRFLFALLTLGCLACTAVIMSPILDAHWVQNYFALIVLALLASAITVWRITPGATIAGRTWWILAAAFVLTSLATVLPFLFHGTTLSALIYVSVLQHKNFAREWFFAAPFNRKSTLWALFSLLLAILWLFRSSIHTRSSVFESALQAFKGVLAVWTTFYLLTMYPEDAYGVHLLKLLTPMSWLVLVCPERAGKSSQMFSRTFICFLAVFVSLYPFPVASAQLLFALVPLLVVVALFWYDVLVWLASVVTVLHRPNTQRLLKTAALVLLAVVYTGGIRGAHRKYAALVPLALPGATDIHVTPTDADTYRWVTAELDRHCASFFSMPGLFSFDFWTGKDTPTMMMMNDWPGFLNTHQQQIVVDDLSRNHTACIVYRPDLVRIFLHGKKLSHSPVADYIHTHFQQIAERNGYHLLIRKGG